MGQALQNALLRFRCPVDSQVFSCTRYRRVQDTMGDVFFVRISYYDLNRVVFQTLGFVTRHGIGHLKGYSSVECVVVIVAHVLFIDRESHYRIAYPFEVNIEDIQLSERTVQLDVKKNAPREALDTSDPALEVIVDHRLKSLGVIK